MDRFLYYLIGAAAALLLLLVAAAIYTEFAGRAPLRAPAAEAGQAVDEADSAAADASPAPSDPDDVWLQEEVPTIPTPVPWTAQDPGAVTTVAYPGFTVLYSLGLGSPLLVQYALVDGAEPKVYPEPIKVKTPDPALVRKAGFVPGAMALENSIRLYFGKAAAQNTALMTNTSPFYPACLEGIWDQFTALEQRWAGNFNWIEVVAGPIFHSPPATVDGLVVPAAFFRAYRRSFGDNIAFIIPQTATDEPLQTFFSSIADIESATGLRIFSNTVMGEDRRKKAEILW